MLRSCVLKVMASIFSIHQDNLLPFSTDLVDILVDAVQDEDIGAEAWRTCTVLTRIYLKESLWEKLQKHFVISAASLKFAEAYASVMSDSNTKWWQVMMEQYLHQASSNTIAAVRAAACDCFASMSRALFEKLHASI